MPSEHRFSSIFPIADLRPSGTGGRSAGAEGASGIHSSIKYAGTPGFMAKYCDEMLVVPDTPLVGEDEDSLLDWPERAIERTACEAAVAEAEEDPEPSFAPIGGFACAGKTSVPAVPKPAETGPGKTARSGGKELAPSNGPQNAASFSRGLIDTYFRQMGDAAWLPRDEEIALAKRIETSQRAILSALCRVPKAVEQIARWARAVADGQHRLVDLFDLSGAGTGPGVDDSAQDYEVAAAGSGDGDVAVPADAGNGYASVTATHLQAILALADEIGSLSGGHPQTGSGQETTYAPERMHRQACR